LKPLERRGLVEITGDPADKRSRLMKLTPVGKALLSSAVPIWERTHKAMEDLLTDTGPDRFRSSLRALA
jgi:DNA-binding MarR family transcriptional regulator